MTLSSQPKGRWFESSPRNQLNHKLTSNGQSIQSDANLGTGVPPVITAGTAVPRMDAKLLVSLCINAVRRVALRADPLYSAPDARYCVGDFLG